MSLRPVYYSLFIVFSFFLAAPRCPLVLAEEPLYPFVAESSGDQVNVRAGQSANFERLCQLSQGDQVVVLEKQFSWYKIQLPPSAKSYVSKEYIQYLGKNAGGVVGNFVNIRAGAGVHFTVLGQLSQGEQIYILEDLKDWYRIEPVTESYGWVTDEYLSFKTQDTSGFDFIRPPIPLIEESWPERKITVEFVEDPQDEAQDELSGSFDAEPQVTIKATRVKIDDDSQVAYEEEPHIEVQEDQQFEEEEEPRFRRKEDLQVETVQRDVKPVYEGIISVKGLVKSHEGDGGNGIFFKIVDSGKAVCYVQGVNHLLGRFVGHQVTVDGMVNVKLQDQYEAPVISVVKVRLML